MVQDLNFKDIPLFKNLPEHEYQHLQETLTCVDVDINTTLIRENDYGNDFYIILEGRLDVIKSMGSMGDRVLTTLTTGDFIGEMSLLNPDGLRTATVFTRTPAKLLQINHSDFKELLERHPDLAFKITRELSNRLRQTDNATIESLREANFQLTRAYNKTLEGWAKALELRDQETEGHTRRVTEMTVKLAEVLQVPDEDLVHIHRGAMLHDIGKMGIPDAILLKPGKLTPEEWIIMRMHPVYAYEMLSQIGFLKPALDIPYCHHEHWDGSGYPRGLKGEEIPLSARIFSVVDVWDALFSDRPYRLAWPAEKVWDHVRSLAGIHFDPQVVEGFSIMYDQGIEKVEGTFETVPLRHLKQKLEKKSA
jgi:putative nucleotidyltransferase with HDIG domain